MKHTRHTVSNQALVAYLERVRGVNIAAIRARIERMTDEACEHEGVSGVVIDGFRYRLADGVVTDVVKARQPSIKTGRVKR